MARDRPAPHRTGVSPAQRTGSGPAATTVAALSTLGALRQVVIVRARGAGRLAQPVAATLTLLGWTVLALAAGSWIAGALLGWRELLLASATAIVALVLAVPFVVGRPTVTVRLDLDPPRVGVGNPAAGRLRFANRTSRRTSPIDLDLPVGQGLATFRVQSLPPGAEDEELFIIPTERRGVIPVGPPIGVKGDPLGLLSRRVPAGEGTELLVHPRTVALPPYGTGLLRDLEGLTTKDVSASDLAFHSLRDYVPGDDLRFVHWRSTAKTGRLQMRQYNDTRRSAITIVVDSTPASYADPSEFELALEVAASLAVRAARDQLPAFLMAGGQAATSMMPHVLLDALSRAELFERSPDLPTVAHMAATRAADTTTAVLLTGSVPGPELTQRGATRFGPEVRVLAVRAVPAGRVALAASGRVTVLDLPRLDDLPALVAAGAVA